MVCWEPFGKAEPGGASSEPLQGDVAEGFTQWELLVLDQLLLPEPPCLPCHGVPGMSQECHRIDINVAQRLSVDPAADSKCVCKGAVC